MCEQGPVAVDLLMLGTVYCPGVAEEAAAEAAEAKHTSWCNGYRGLFYPDLYIIACRCTRCLTEAHGRGKAFYPFDFERHAGMGANKRWKSSVRVAGMHCKSLPSSGGGGGGGGGGSAADGCMSLGRFMEIQNIQIEPSALARSSTAAPPPPPPPPTSSALVQEAAAAAGSRPPTAAAAMRVGPPTRRSTSAAAAAAAGALPPPGVPGSSPEYPPATAASPPVPVASYSQLGPRHRAALFPVLPPNVPRMVPPELQGHAMVGHRVRIYWPIDKVYYSVDPTAQRCPTAPKNVGTGNDFPGGPSSCGLGGLVGNGGGGGGGGEEELCQALAAAAPVTSAAERDGGGGADGGDGRLVQARPSKLQLPDLNKQQPLQQQPLQQQPLQQQPLQQQPLQGPSGESIRSPYSQPLQPLQLDGSGEEFDGGAGDHKTPCGGTTAVLEAYGTAAAAAAADGNMIESPDVEPIDVVGPAAAADGTTNRTATRSGDLLQVGVRAPSIGAVDVAHVYFDGGGSGVAAAVGTDVTEAAVRRQQPGSATPDGDVLEGSLVKACMCAEEDEEAEEEQQEEERGQGHREGREFEVEAEAADSPMAASDSGGGSPAAAVAAATAAATAAKRVHPQALSAAAAAGAATDRATNQRRPSLAKKAAAAAAAAAGRELDGAMPVTCNYIDAWFLLRHKLVACDCVGCRTQPGSGKRICWTPIGFEEHAGMRASKKWKNSIRMRPGAEVEVVPEPGHLGAGGGGGGEPLGEWLDRRGVVVPPSKQRRRVMEAAEVERCVLAPITGVSKVSAAVAAPPDTTAAAAAAAAAARLAAGSIRPASNIIAATRKPATAADTAAVPRKRGRDVAAGTPPRPPPSLPASGMEATAAAANYGGEVVIRGPGYNVLRCSDPPGFEVFCLVAGYLLEEVSVRAYDYGKVIIQAQPRNSERAALWGISPLRHVVQLPGAVHAESAQALMTLHGQLYVRINAQ
ncbi:hypothetical protein VOLCADRAFT_91035 [Volvox carteri f. nagariensis]|uniref:SAND domain-containing protein n=1 Tax=Volvox carteri f. nagariensis TaxID=3068 RepID=D8TW06_VOLCA|nr:uncharacterized protein VOLCADRAFT_91035 [Volvox carteri f. nagariensis]EFJ48286.1 hypothetical protein VOLCADRAFT_91035 [Volvox carteri f. nagariensis]|eukprot:XP_002950540.1 hypothetical protein VOLCADRAFT_91035 [Volvox carteri f. nagariensis]